MNVRHARLLPPCICLRAPDECTRTFLTSRDRFVLCRMPVPVLDTAALMQSRSAKEDLP